MSLFSELRRRNVFKVALVYAVAAWLIEWLVARLITAFAMSPWVGDYVLLLIAIGFPVALIFAWVYEITPEGLKKGADVDQTQSIVYKTGQKLNAALAVLAVLGVAAVVGERLLPEFVPPPPVVLEEIPLRPVFDVQKGISVPDEIASFTLGNGLRIIVWPDRDIPNAVFYNFVRAGARNEYPGITGLSHFFEHMMFNGTKNLDPGEFDEVMEAAGGSNNAYTSPDLTVYMDWFPRTALETIFKLEGERLENLVIDTDSVESERGVVYSERRLSVDNDNTGLLFEQVMATAYVAHPYQFPVIGWPSDIEGWTQEDLENYYETYYAPNNCTIVVAGDVDPVEIFLLADRYFAGIPAQAPPPAVTTVEPQQRGERRLLIETEAQTPLLHLAFHADATSDPQTLQMELLLKILADGDSSRLNRQLVEEEQLVLDLGVLQTDGFDPGLVYFYLTLPPDGDAGVVEERVFDELSRIAAQGVTDAELAKARNVMLADFWRSLQTINGKAHELGKAAVFGGNYETLFSRPDQISAVSADDLAALAARVFTRTNVTVGVLRSPETEE